MSVYDFLYLITSLDGINVSVFDCNTEEVVFSNTDGDANLLFLALSEAGYHDYEVEGVDIFTDKDGIICIELNIDTAK